MSSPKSTFHLACLILLWTTLAVPGELVGLPPQVPLPVGTFSGTFSSNRYGSFPLTISIVQDSNGRLSGTAKLTSKCLSDATVQVTVSGTSITIAGSDAAGDNITFKGQIDPTTSQLTLSYIANGSASGRCETDGGWGSLTKR